MVTQQLALDATFAGRYKVGRCIASGGMGAVYEVQHTETERISALKVMLPHVLSADHLREQFLREAKVAAKLKSEHIVDVLDAGVDQDTDMPYLVMELLEGEDLSTRLGRLGPLPAEEVVSFLHQAALALDRVHKRGIVHRDLKPENLFLTERDDGSPLVKILDFGIAKVLTEGLTGAGRTQDGCGTPVYMAPEQFSQDYPVSAATDIYALGMLAFTLLVDAPYWSKELDKGVNVFVLARQAERGPREPATARAAERGIELPPAFDAWFSKITSVEPKLRHARATEAVRDLAEVLGVPFPGRSGARPSHPEQSGDDGDRPSFADRPSFPDRPSPIGRAVTPQRRSPIGPAPASPRRAPPDVPTLANPLDRSHSSDAPMVSSPPPPMVEDRGSLEMAPATAHPTLDVSGPPPRSKRQAAARAVVAALGLAAVGLAVFLTARSTTAPGGEPERTASAASSVGAIALAPSDSTGAAPAPLAPPSEITVAPAPLPSADPTASSSASARAPATAAPSLAAPPPRPATSKTKGEPAASSSGKKPARFTQD